MDLGHECQVTLSEEMSIPCWTSVAVLETADVDIIPRVAYDVPLIHINPRGFKSKKIPF